MLASFRAGWRAMRPSRQPSRRESRLAWRENWREGHASRRASLGVAAVPPGYLVPTAGAVSNSQLQCGTVPARL